MTIDWNIQKSFQLPQISYLRNSISVNLRKRKRLTYLEFITKLKNIRASLSNEHKLNISSQVLILVNRTSSLLG